MKKLIAGLMLSSCVLGLAMPAFAQDGTEAGTQQPINGKNSAEIEVNGTLGADNKDPNATIPEGDDNWINVTVPTKTIFYNTATNTDITSPTYDIVNNSGRPVKVSLQSFTYTGDTDLTLPTDYSLKLNITNGTNTGIVVADAGKADFNSLTDLITLANTEGNLQPSETPGTDANKTTFSFGGTATPAGQVQPTYTMTLKFVATPWN